MSKKPKRAKPAAPNAGLPHIPIAAPAATPAMPSPDERARAFSLELEALKTKWGVRQIARLRFLPIGPHPESKIEGVALGAEILLDVTR